MPRGNHGIGSLGYGGFRKWGYPNSWLVFVRENPIQMDEMDDLGGTPVLGNLHISFNQGSFPGPTMEPRSDGQLAEELLETPISLNMFPNSQIARQGRNI